MRCDCYSIKQLYCKGYVVSRQKNIFMQKVEGVLLLIAGLTLLSYLARFSFLTVLLLMIAFYAIFLGFYKVGLHKLLMMAFDEDN